MHARAIEILEFHATLFSRQARELTDAGGTDQEQAYNAGQAAFCEAATSELAESISALREVQPLTAGYVDLCELIDLLMWARAADEERPRCRVCGARKPEHQTGCAVRRHIREIHGEDMSHGG